MGSLQEDRHFLSITGGHAEELAIIDEVIHLFRFAHPIALGCLEAEETVISQSSRLQMIVQRLPEKTILIIKFMSPTDRLTRYLVRILLGKEVTQVAENGRRTFRFKKNSLTCELLDGESTFTIS